MASSDNDNTVSWTEDPNTSPDPTVVNTPPSAADTSLIFELDDLFPHQPQDEPTPNTDLIPKALELPLTEIEQILQDLQPQTNPTTPQTLSSQPPQSPPEHPLIASPIPWEQLDIPLSPIHPTPQERATPPQQLQLHDLYCQDQIPAQSPNEFSTSEPSLEAHPSPSTGTSFASHHQPLEQTPPATPVQYLTTLKNRETDIVSLTVHPPIPIPLQNKDHLPSIRLQPFREPPAHRYPNPPITYLQALQTQKQLTQPTNSSPYVHPLLGATSLLSPRTRLLNTWRHGPKLKGQTPHPQPKSLHQELREAIQRRRLQLLEQESLARCNQGQPQSLLLPNHQTLPTTTATHTSSTTHTNITTTTHTLQSIQTTLHTGTTPKSTRNPESQSKSLPNNPATTDHANTACHTYTPDKTQTHKDKPPIPPKPACIATPTTPTNPTTCNTIHDHRPTASQPPSPTPDPVIMPPITPDPRVLHVLQNETPPATPDWPSLTDSSHNPTETPDTPTPQPHSTTDPSPSSESSQNPSSNNTMTSPTTQKTKRRNIITHLSSPLQRTFYVMDPDPDNPNLFEITLRCRNKSGQLSAPLPLRQCHTARNETPIYTTFKTLPYLPNNRPNLYVTNPAADLLKIPETIYPRAQTFPNTSPKHVTIIAPLQPRPQACILTRIASSYLISPRTTNPPQIMCQICTLKPSTKVRAAGPTLAIMDHICRSCKWTHTSTIQFYPPTLQSTIHLLQTIPAQSSIIASLRTRTKHTNPITQMPSTWLDTSDLPDSIHLYTLDDNKLWTSLNQCSEWPSTTENTPLSQLNPIFLGKRLVLIQSTSPIRALCLCNLAITTNGHLTLGTHLGTTPPHIWDTQMSVVTFPRSYQHSPSSTPTPTTYQLPLSSLPSLNLAPTQPMTRDTLTKLGLTPILPDAADLTRLLRLIMPTLRATNQTTPPTAFRTMATSQGFNIVPTRTLTLTPTDIDRLFQADGRKVLQPH